METNRSDSKKILERKICYDSTIVEHECILLNKDNQRVVLFHKIKDSFTMESSSYKLTIPYGSYTLAFYWRDKPFNLYVWRDAKGSYLGSYFNIVKNTDITDMIVSFEDLVIDVLVFPNGNYYILDENELPLPIKQFENGYVYWALGLLTNSINKLVSQILTETEKSIKHEDIIMGEYRWLQHM